MRVHIFQIAKAVLGAILFSLAFVLVFTVIIQLFSVPPTAVKPVNQVFKVLAICAGGLIFIRGEKGLVTDALKKLIDSGEKYDEVIAIGPLIMMKFVCALTKEYGIKTVVSMNPIMIDGTGMCGGCRLSVGGETKFACV